MFFILSGYLNKVTKAIVDSLIQYDIQAKEPELLTALTKPLTSLIIQLDKEVLKNISIGKITFAISTHLKTIIM